MAHPKLSVVIPIYNAQAYLGKCLDSILTQSFKNYEIILVDDGSTDKSGMICDQYAEKHGHIIVIHKANAGVSAARNTGIEQSRGEWIYFCDADDELNTEGLGKFMNHALADIDLIASTFEKEPDENDTVKKEITSVTEFTPRDYAHALFSGINGDYQGYLWSKLFRASIIREKRIYFDTTITHNEDRLFILNYLLEVKGKVIYLPENTYRYFVRDSGAMKSLQSSESYWKFRSDLKSFIEMGKIALLWHDSFLTKLIKYGTFDSGSKNKALIKKYSNNPEEEKKEIDRIVIESIGRRAYYKLTLRSIIKRIIKNFKK